MSRKWAGLALVLLMLPAAGAQSGGHVDGRAPLELHGDISVEGPDLRLFHYGSEAEVLAGIVYRGTLYEVKHAQGEDPRSRAVATIEPSEAYEFRLEPGAVVTATLPKGLQFQVAPTGFDTNATPAAGAVAVAGPNPARAASVDPDGPDDPWTTVPAYPTTGFVVAPTSGWNTTSPIEITLHAGNLTLGPAGDEPSRYRAGVTTASDPVGGPLLPPSSWEEYDVAVSYVLNATLAVTSLRTEGPEPVLDHWTGAKDAQAPGVDAARGHWPRETLDALGPGLVDLGLPRTVLAADELAIHLDGVARIHGIVDPDPIGAEGVEPGDTLDLGGELLLQPVNPSDDARAFRLLVAGRVDRVGPGPSGDGVLQDAAMWAGLGLVGAVGLAWAWPALKFGLARYLVVPLYARIHKDEVLEHPVRDDILTTVSDQPGISASELGRRTRCGWGTLVYHLSVLEREKMVWSTREGRHRRYFAQGRVNYSDRDALGLLRNASSRRLADAVRQTPGVIQKDLSHRLGLSPSTIAWHIDRLERAGLVLKEADGRQVRYYPSGRLDDLAAQIQLA